MNYKFNWALIFSGEYGQWFLDGLSVTLQLSGLSILLAVLLGTLLTVLRLSRVKPLEWLAAGYIEFFRNTPLVVQIFFWYFGSDPLLPPFFKEWLYKQNIEFATGVIALTTYTAAFLAEELRSGILSIPRTQIEASRATGLSFLQSMRYVILPQAFKRVLPPLAGQFINLIKDSSLVSVISITDLTKAGREVVSSTFSPFEVWFTVALLYLVLTGTLSFLVRRLEVKYARSN